MVLVCICSVLVEQKLSPPEQLVQLVSELLPSINESQDMPVVLLGCHVACEVSPP